jgi:hypothetical protein
MESAGLKLNEKIEEKPVVDTLTKPEKDAAKLLIKNMTINFESRNFENPTI